MMYVSAALNPLCIDPIPSKRLLGKGLLPKKTLARPQLRREKGKGKGGMSVKSSRARERERCRTGNA